MNKFFHKILFSALIFGLVFSFSAVLTPKSAESAISYSVCVDDNNLNPISIYDINSRGFSVYLRGIGYANRADLYVIDADNNFYVYKATSTTSRNHTISNLKFFHWYKVKVYLTDPCGQRHTYSTYVRTVPGYIP